MNGKNYNKNLSTSLIVLVVITAVIGILGYLSNSETVTTKHFYLKNSRGAVLFEHQNHIDMVEGCEECHHEVVLSDDKTDCSECHDDDYLPEDFSHEELTMISDHTCSYCHQIGDYENIQSCRICHPAESEESGLIGCEECHDDYDQDLLTHDEMQEIHEESCENCHNTQILSAVYHDNCCNCHLDEDPKYFSNSDGSIRCQICHLK